MRVENLRTPCLLADLDVLKRNLKKAQSMADACGAALRPHYKSHKCTALAKMQIDGGAKGITCAKLEEAEDLAEAGIEDILIANQVCGPEKAALAAYLAACCRLTVCVDRAENIWELERAAACQGSHIHVYIEFDIGMNRCGVRSLEEFFELASLADKQPHLSFDGIPAYAGQLAHEYDASRRAAEAEKAESAVKELRTYLAERGLPAKEVSGVSTGTVGFRSPESVYTEWQIGSYLLMDGAYGKMETGFDNALFLLTTVISDAGGPIITDGGVKELGMDQVPACFRECPEVPVGFSEEHSQIPASSYPAKVGDKLFLVPGHGCTTVNLHDWLYLVSGGKVVDRIPVTSRGRGR